MAGDRLKKRTITGQKKVQWPVKKKSGSRLCHFELLVSGFLKVRSPVKKKSGDRPKKSPVVGLFFGRSL